MKGQRGSVLAGVVGFTVLITAALGSFLVFAGGSTRLEADSEAEAQLHHAAESAMAMGLRWLRTYPDTKTGDKNWPASPVVLNSATNDFTYIGGAWIKVIFMATPSPAFQEHKLRCLATLGSGRDTLEINYFLSGTSNSSLETEAGTTLYKVSMIQWRETIHPGR